MSENSINISEMSGIEEQCFICENGMGINHLCINLEDFRNIAISDSNQEEFELFPPRQMEELEYEEIVEFNDEGDQDIVEAELSIIDDLEESNGYITLTYQSPRQLAPVRRRSSTPDPTRSRRSSITFDEFLENLMDDSIDMPGLEQDATDESATEESVADEAAADQAVENEADYSEWMEF